MTARVDQRQRPTVYYARGVDGLPIDDVLQAGRQLAAIATARWSLLLIDPVRLLHESAAGRAFSSSEIVQHDLGLLRRADAFMAYLADGHRSYVGCIAELTYAHIWQIPTVVVVGDAQLAERHWLIHHSSAICASLSDGMRNVARILAKDTSLHYYPIGDPMTNTDATELTRAFYERHASEYVENTRGMLDTEWLAKFVGRLPGSKVLDVGTAGGRDARWFRARGLDVVGIDYAPQMIQLAEASSQGEGIDFRVEDLRHLTFADGTFDGVWCSCVLIHLRKGEVPAALAELSRVLKPGGILYVLVKLGDKEGVEKDARYGGAEKFAAYFTEQELESALRDAGFTILETEDIDVPVDDYRAKDRVFFLAANGK